MHERPTPSPGSTSDSSGNVDALIPEPKDDRPLPSAARRVTAPRRVTARGCGLIALTGLVVLAALAALFFLVLVPYYQPPVDPRIGDVEIARTGNDNRANSEAADERGSITDSLARTPATPPEHPLDPVLDVARAGLRHIEETVRDYTCQVVKQERIGNQLTEEQYMHVKVRHARPDENPPVPKSFYLKFDKPGSLAGQEVIWVDGRNNGRLVAHQGGLLNFRRWNLPTDGFLAMHGNRYPITELGIETLIIRLIEKGEKERQHGECEIDVDRDLLIDGHRATCITITHPQRREHFEYHRAKVYIDDELNLPVGYEGFDWPVEPGGEPLLAERYFYRDLETNVGLTDRDFDPDNPDYDFP